MDSFLDNPAPSEPGMIVSKLKEMEIQGADRILRSAMSAILLYCESYESNCDSAFVENLVVLCERLRRARPTCAALLNGISYIRDIIPLPDQSVDPHPLKKRVAERAKQVIEYSLHAKEQIAHHTVVTCGAVERVMTLCSSQTVIDSVMSLHQNSPLKEVVVLETRPRFQGRKTARALADHRIAVTLSLDSLASTYLPSTDVVLMGADAVFQTGDVLNKVGSYQLALLASLYDKPVYVLTAKHKTVALSSAEYGIEQRPLTEVVPEAYLREVDGVSLCNPAYDLVPAGLLEAVVCEAGAFPPSKFPRKIAWE